MAEIKTEDIYIEPGQAPKTGFDTDDMVLQMGPQHPSTHGVLRLRMCNGWRDYQKSHTAYWLSPPLF